MKGSAANLVWQLAETTGIKLVSIPAGTFMMGDPKDNQHLNTADGHRAPPVRQGPQTRVTLTRGFFLGATPVTQGQYESLMGTNPSAYKDAGKDAPVEQVSWDNAMAFCQKLTERERVVGTLPSGNVFTLPTEAQWEYACRAGKTGENLNGPAAIVVEVRDYRFYATIPPVATKRPNGWRLYDMQGNVLEWCRNWYEIYPGGEVTDPVGPATGMIHMVRGSVWVEDNRDAGVSRREGISRQDSSSYVGFRVALVPGSSK